MSPAHVLLVGATGALLLGHQLLLQSDPLSRGGHLFDDIHLLLWKPFIPRLVVGGAAYSMYRERCDNTQKHGFAGLVPDLASLQNEVGIVRVSFSYIGLRFE